MTKRILSPDREASLLHWFARVYDVPGAAAGCLGSELNLTRPPVAFSTSLVQLACQMVR